MKNEPGRDLCNHDEAIATIVSDDEGAFFGVHLLRWDGLGAWLQCPLDLDLIRYDGDWIKQNANRILVEVERAYGSAKFEEDPISRLAAREGCSPAQAGMLRYFGMGHWGMDVGVVRLSS